MNSGNREHKNVILRPSIAWLAIAGLMIGGQVLAATINVPADQPTIQAGINAAAAGDTVLVAPGTYNENVVINKANLKLLSSGPGAIIQSNVNDTPVVDITAPGATVGGPGQGFTIHQKDAGPAAVPHNGNCAIRIRGQSASSATAPTTITIANNHITGNQTDEGLLVNSILTNAHLIVTDCGFARNAGTFGFKYAVYFYETNPGGDLNTLVSTNSDTIDLTNLTATEFNVAGVCFSDTIHKSTVNITGGSYTGTAAANYGLRFGNSINNFSTVNISGTTLANIKEGIDVHDQVGQHSAMNITNLTVTNFRDTGIYIDYVYSAGTCRILNSTLTGDGVNADYGIYSDTEYSSATIIDGNTITGVGHYGIYENYSYSNSSSTITNNHISMFVKPATDGYGIYADTDYNCTTVIRGNIVNGFNYAGIYDDDSYAGSNVTIDANILNADAAGADYGIYSYGPEYDSQTTITNNASTGFTSIGLYVYYTDYGSQLTVTGNTIAGLAASGGDYGLYLYCVGYQSTANVSGNTVTGFTDTGLEIDYVYYDSSLTANNNVLTALASGAQYGIDAYDIYEGGAASFAGNQVSGFGNTPWAEYGFYNDEVYDGGTLTLTNNTFSARSSGADYGFYSNSGFQYGAVATFTGNTFTSFTDTGFYAGYPAYCGVDLTLTGNTFTGAAAGAGYGLYFNNDVDYGGNANVTNNTFSNFTAYGMYLYGVDDGSSMLVHNNRLTCLGGGGGTLYGIYYNDYTDYGSVNEVSGNIVNVADPDGAGANEAYGIYLEGATDGGTEKITDNIVNGTAGAQYGIYCNYVADYGSVCQVLRNQVSGFTNTALYLNDDTNLGGNFRCEDNQLTGGQYGICYDSSYEIGSGGIATVRRNIVRDFTIDGLYIGGPVWASKLLISLNRFVGGAAAANGVVFGDDINSGAEVTLTSNCISGVTTGINVDDITDTSFLVAHLNDLAGTGTGIANVNGDVAHTINAQNNFFGATTPATGNVDTSAALAAAPDEDADGVVDCSDNCPSTVAGQTADANGCSCLQLHPTADADADGTLDCNDACMDDPNKVAPGACGCGIPDTDTDGDGTPDCIDGCPSDPNKAAPGACGCGVAEVDGDGDGTPNCVDGCPSDVNKVAPGACGCGAAETDTDGDGTPDCVDECPADAGKIVAGECGCGTADTDLDGNGVADCIDAAGQTIPTTGCGAGTCGAGVASVLPLMILGLISGRRAARRRGN